MKMKKKTAGANTSTYTDGFYAISLTIRIILKNKFLVWFGIVSWSGGWLLIFLAINRQCAYTVEPIQPTSVCFVGAGQPR